MRLTFASAIALLLVACGTSDPRVQPPRAPDGIEQFGSGRTLRYLILGDSTAVGVGGTYELGIARRTALHLADDRTVEMKNLGVSGARVADVLHEQLPRIGSFVPDLVLLDVGANDVIHLTSARSLERDLARIIQTLRSIHCDIRIVVTGAAAMDTPPRIPRGLRWLAASRTRALNAVFQRTVEREQLTFAPIARETGPLFRSDPTLFDSDRFHPNDRGYATWIDVIEPALDRALAEPPRCAGKVRDLVD